MIKKILVPIAFSPYTKGMLSFAADLAGPLEAQLMVVNIVNERDLEAVEKISSFGYKVDSKHYVETILKEREEELEKLMADLTLPDDQVSFTFRVGNPTTELLKIVLKEEIDVVVMGIRAKEISQLFAGSVAERMFRRCPATIISYRDKEISDRLKNKASRYIERH